jgi:hypothetical protein
MTNIRFRGILSRGARLQKLFNLYMMAMETRKKLDQQPSMHVVIKCLRIYQREVCEIVVLHVLACRGC